MSKEKKDSKNNKIIVYVVIAVIILLGLMVIFMTGNSSNNGISVVNDGANVGNNDNQVASNDDIEGLKSARFEVPTELMLFDDKGVSAFVNYDLDSDNKNGVKVIVEEISGDFKSEALIPYSRTGNEISKEIKLNLNDKEDIGKHKFKAYMMLGNDIVLEDEFEVNVVGKYAFADDLTAEVEVQDILFNLKISGYPDSLKSKTNFTMENDGVVILSKTKYGYGTTITHGWMSNDPEKEKYTNLVNPTITIYDEERELYVVKDLPIAVK